MDLRQSTYEEYSSGGPALPPDPQGPTPRNTKVGPWRPTPEPGKIKFPQPVKNSLKTAISIHDFAYFWPETTNGSFCLFLDTSDGADLQEQRIPCMVEYPGKLP